MSNVIIACQTLKDEVEKIMELVQCNNPVIWVDSEYHNDPNKLRTKLQEIIDTITYAENILLVYGCCGNGLVGLKATTANLIIPKTDDCISLVLTKQNEKFDRMKKTYFLTKGWIEGSKSMLTEYKYSLNRYGPKRTERLFQTMLKNYQYLMLIDTGAYEIDEYISKAHEFAQIMNLELTVAKGELWLIQKLLTGPYDHNFASILKGQKVTSEAFVHSSF